MWVDAGLREAADARLLIKAGVAVIVAGLETLSGHEALARLCREQGSERVVFSLDLKAGVSLGKAEAWSGADPLAIAAAAVASGARRLLVLDLAQVGAGTGTGTEKLCRQLRRDFPHVSLAACGGIGSLDHVRRLAASGVGDVLIASALHDGRISKIDELE